MSAGTWMLLALAGSAGAVARLLVVVRLPRAGVEVVNLTGAFALGLVSAAGASVHAVAATGALGAFTTFSTWMVEAGSERAGRRRAARLGVPLVAGVAAVALGRTLGGAG